MMLFKNRKGLDYAISLMAVVLICLIFLFVQVNKKAGGITRDVGDVQIGIMQSQQDSDSMLLYLDQSAKQAAYKASYLLASNGGFASESESCGGAVKRYFSWNSCDNPELICFPNVFHSFNELMENSLDAYLASYELLPGVVPFVKDNYVLTIHDGRITGTAIKNIELNTAPYMPRAEVYSVGRYSFKPSFSIDFDYDFNKYFELKEIASEVAKCANKFADSELRDQCVLSKAPNASFIGDTAFFEAVQPEHISPYANQPQVILFSLCIPTLS